MEKSKKNYWAVYRRHNILFEGSHTECWKWLVGEFSKTTLRLLDADGVRIGRIG